MFARRSGFTIGVGGGDRVHLSRDGVELDGEIFVSGARDRTATGRYAWDELLDVRVQVRKSTPGERLLAVFERLPIHDTFEDADYSLFGHVVVTVVPTAHPDEPRSVSVPMQIRWHPDRSWVERLGADIARALVDRSARERFA